MTTAPPPRIAPLVRDEWNENLLDALAAMGVPVDQPVVNVLLTIGRHPRLLKSWGRFSGILMTGEIPGRERELLILRTGWNCRSEYEWGQHAKIGRHEGLGDEEIVRITQDAGHPSWSGRDRTLLRAADELHSDNSLSDATWQELTSFYDDHQMLELLMVVGQYHLVSFLLNSVRVEREEGIEGFPTLT